MMTKGLFKMKNTVYDAANCDECRNEEFRNNPDWWLTLEERERDA